MPALENSRRRRRRKRRIRPRAPIDVVRPPGYRRIVGDWLYALAPWSVFATLTFGDQVSEFRAEAAFHRWARAVARLCGHHVTIAFASDYQVGGFWHFHALLDVASLGGSTRELILILNQLWRLSDSDSGWTDFRRYDSRQGGAWYLPEHVSVGAGVACPRRARCRRKAGCKVSRCPM